MNKFKPLCFITISCLLITGSVHDPVMADIFSYRDKSGRVVKVNVPVKRAILLTTYELIPALGIKNQIAAIGKWMSCNDLMKSSCGDMSGLPAVGFSMDINMEAMMRIRPDLIISWSFREEQIQFMQNRGLTVIGIYPDSFAELSEIMKLHGKVFGKEKRTEFCLSQMEGIFSIIKKKSAKIKNADRQKIVWLGAQPTIVSGSEGIHHDLIKLIGADNAGAVTGGRSCNVTVEKILRWNPDVIFIWGNAKYSPSEILNNPQWKHVKAVKDRRVYKAPDWSIWSPRIAPVALWMAIKTYPSLYRDVNLNQVIDNFYRKVFNIRYDMVTKIEN